MINLAESYFALKEKILTLEYAHLNPVQRQAVFTVNGPLLILAGAGSGKTTVLVNRIAHILKYGDTVNSFFIPTTLKQDDIDFLQRVALKAEADGFVSLCSDDKARIRDLFYFTSCQPWNVLAITFTNKAAKELKDRIIDTLGTKGEDIWACTFHSCCLRFLRGNSEYIGYKGKITIYDTDDQIRVIKKCYGVLNIDEKKFPPRTILSSIGRLKDKLITPEQAIKENSADYYSKVVSSVYEQYQKSLLAANAMDFDDIIMQTVRLFCENPQVLQKFQKQFKYILVDEYQDTNHAQFVLVSLLARKVDEQNQNICVVGDDDQSIYKFRGATIENILNFEDTFDNATVVKLEENYRCTQPILDAANSVIANNTQRKEKKLWTEKAEGEKVLFIKTADESTESEIIVKIIKENIISGGKYSDSAVLYRMNAQSNTIEKIFARRNIPYKIFGGLRFYDRKEIKDMLAYLWLIVNPDDNIRLLRVINEPKRGIGQTTMERVATIASEHNTSIYNVIKSARDYPEIEARSKLLDPFIHLIEDLKEFSKTNSLDMLYDKLLEDSGYANSLLLHGEEGETRLNNIKELKTNILEFIKKYEMSTKTQSITDLGYEAFNAPDIESSSALESFLNEVSLATELDNLDNSNDFVSLMTIHSSKGLEFKNVFLPAIEETIFPSMRCVQEGDLEEERRLAYVAITRAKQHLYIINAQKRVLFGKTSYNEMSRFVKEIAPESIETFDQTKAATETQDSESRSDISMVISSYKKALGKAANARSFYPQKSNANLPFSVGVSASTASATKKSFSVGDNVMHKKFGNGVVIAVKSMGNDTLVEIDFASCGAKKIMANLAPVEKV